MYIYHVVLLFLWKPINLIFIIYASVYFNTHRYKYKLPYTKMVFFEKKYFLYSYKMIFIYIFKLYISVYSVLVGLGTLLHY